MIGDRQDRVENRQSPELEPYTDIQSLFRTIHLWFAFSFSYLAKHIDSVKSEIWNGFAIEVERKVHNK